MGTVQNLSKGKNELWDVYTNAAPGKHAQIVFELKQSGLYRHWQQVASKEGHDLRMAKAPLRDIFLKVMPETAHYFGVTL